MRLLEDLGVLVILIGVGNEVFRSELNIILFNLLDVIFVCLNINLLVLVVCIMERIFRCKLFCLVLF